jgi:hypothetical protein
MSPDPSGGFVWWTWYLRRKELKLLAAQLDLIEHRLQLLENQLLVGRTLAHGGHRPPDQDVGPVP